MIEIITGDILESKDKYLLHQTNTISNTAGGLAYSIFEKYPYANIYSNRTEQSIPGTIDICGNGEDKRFIINMMGQVYPGPPRFPESNLDGSLIREKYFHKCLLKVANIPNLESVAMPVGIGCGLGGGEWSHYLQTIINFAKFINEKQGAIVNLYKLEI